MLLNSPNLWWQYQHQFPILDMFSRLYETQLNKLTIGGVVKELIIMLNPVTLFIWGGGHFPITAASIYGAPKKESFPKLSLHLPMEKLK